jgi:hypothetical protein
VQLLYCLHSEAIRQTGPARPKTRPVHAQQALRFLRETGPIQRKIQWKNKWRDGKLITSARTWFCIAGSGAGHPPEAILAGRLGQPEEWRGSTFSGRVRGCLYQGRNLKQGRKRVSDRFYDIEKSAELGMNPCPRP